MLLIFLFTLLFFHAFLIRKKYPLKTFLPNLAFVDGRIYIIISKVFIGQSFSSIVSDPDPLFSTGFGSRLSRIFHNYILNLIQEAFHYEKQLS